MPREPGEGEAGAEMRIGAPRLESLRRTEGEERGLEAAQLELHPGDELDRSRIARLERGEVLVGAQRVLLLPRPVERGGEAEERIGRLRLEGEHALPGRGGLAVLAARGEQHGEIAARRGGARQRRDRGATRVERGRVARRRGAEARRRGGRGGRGPGGVCGGSCRRVRGSGHLGTADEQGDAKGREDDTEPARRGARAGVGSGARDHRRGRRRERDPAARPSSGTGLFVTDERCAFGLRFASP